MRMYNARHNEKQAGTTGMDWYVVYTKLRQEHRAFRNLDQQGFECFLPMLAVEKLRQGVLARAEEPLFPRYLFVRADAIDSGARWGAVRSTKGVSRLVTFGNEPARVSPQLVDKLRSLSNAATARPQSIFRPGERLLITQGPFAGIEAIYQMTEGDSRVMVLIELLSKLARLSLSPANLRRIG